MKQIIFISSHPIQYFAPMYQSLAEEGLPLQVYYCSRHGLEGELDKEFATAVKWDIPLFTGYSYRFFKNYFTKPSVYHFLGLINPGIVKALLKEPKSVVVIHGWKYLTNVMAIVAAKLAGHTVCLRAETPLCHEMKRTPGSRRLRSIILKRLLFPWFNYFLYIGNDNKAFYRFYGVKEKQLIFSPYAVDNKRFTQAYQELIVSRNQIRAKMGIPETARLLLFSGKYIDKKRPMDLLRAVEKVQQEHKNVLLFMVGEGELRSEMEQYINKHQLKNIVLTGFINQQTIAQYYLLADVFVMCSDVGETWGLSVNEAMNFHLPLIVSDLTGCAQDLVKDGANGYTFSTGNIDALSEKLAVLLSLSDAALQGAGKISKEIVDHYSYRQTAVALNQIACVY